MFGKETLKVFMYWDEDCKPEVRRFDVEKSAVNSFQKLNAKLQHVFPELKDKTYSVTWKDEEGDDITISSDEEVSFALSNMTSDGNIIKLSILVKDSDEVADCDIMIPAVHNYRTVGPTGLRHCGVKCDSCNTAVWGFRYKCSTCEDFDLCVKCETAGVHPEHCMVRIPTPIMPHTMIKTAIKKSRNFLNPFAGGKNRITRKNLLDSLTMILSEMTKLARDIEQNQGKGLELNKKSANVNFYPWRNNAPFKMPFSSQFPNQFVNPTQLFGQPHTTQHKSPFGNKAFENANSFSFGTKPAEPAGVLFSASAPKPDQTETNNPEPVLAAQPEPMVIPSVEPTQHHPIPHINKAIEQLLGMGFTNEGGWLTQLAEYKDGNVSAVLEYLPQVNQPTQ